MRLPFLVRLICALLFMLSIGHEARAEYQGLLLLGNPFQGVKLEYELQDIRRSSASTSTTSSDRNLFSETYFVSLPFAVLNRDIFEGSLNLNARFLQNFTSTSSGGSDSGTGVGLTYGLTGVFTRKKPLTLYINASSSRDWSQQEFSPGYDTTTLSYGATAYYKHPVVPVTVKYSHDESDSSGANISTFNSRDLISLTASNLFRNVFQTTLGISYDMVRNRQGFSADQPLDTLSIDFNNSASWTFSRPNTPGFLSSSYSYNQSTGATQLDSYMVREAVNQSLGRALNVGAAYSYSAEQSPAYAVTTSTGNIFLNHKLFDSLRTNLTAQGIFSRVPTGELNQLGGTGSLSYLKLLPFNSNLSLSVSEAYLWSEQKRISSLNTQFNEQIKVTDLGKLYLLANANVTAITQVWNAGHTVPYFSPGDWDKVQIGDQTYLTINASGQIHTGDTILVTYSYRTDPELTTAATTLSLSGSYSVAGDLFRAYSLLTLTNQSLLAGSARFAPLGHRTTLAAGAESHFLHNTVGFRYDTTDDARQSQYGLTGYWSFGRDFGKNRFNLSASDSYSAWTDKVSSRGSWSNNVNASALFSRVFTRSSQGTIRAGYLLTDGTTRREGYYAGLDYGIGFGKLRFLLRAQSILSASRDSGQSILNNIFHLTITRYFY